MKKLFFLFLSGLVLNLSAQDVMTPELLWKLKRIGEIAVSPDYTTIAFTQREYDVASSSSESNIYLVGLQGESVRQISTTKGSEYNLTWSADSKSLMYLANSAQGPNIFSMLVATGETKQISFIEGGLGGFKISADGKLLVYNQEIKLEKFTGKEFHSDMPDANVRIIEDLMYRHWSDWEDGMRSHVFYATSTDGAFKSSGTDIMAGELFESPMKPFGGIEHFTIAPDNKTILYVCKKLSGTESAVSTNSDIYAYNIETKTTSNLSAGMMGYDVDPAYSADGKQLAWLSMKTNGYEADKNDIVVRDLTTNQITNLTAPFDLTVTAFTWSPKGDKIYFKSVKEATYQFFEYDFKKKEIRQITTGDNDYTSISFAGDYLIGGRQNMNHPTDIFSVEIKSGTQKQLTDVKNRRGLPGFGQEWNDAIREDWGGQPINDYLSAVDEMSKEPYVDADRLGAVGASYGGYSVYYLAGVHENRFKCFISHCGLFNLESWYGTTEEIFFANSDIGGPYFGAQSPASYLEDSPHKKVNQWNTPMLVFHGEQDFRVPLNQGLEAFQALQLKGIDSKLVLFPDENHFVLQPQNAIIWHREFYAWLDKHLK
ncbi:MAG: S9 family peptidase [Crocinitomicaceae bacterium]|nr:S9 family peptidase [Crocinitomicaceae bacterium]